MDSFYAAPRQPPRPPTINPTVRTPSVPEVSIFDNPTFPTCKTFKPRDFNPPFRPQNIHNDKDSSFMSSSSFSKKQVRFNNPGPEPNFAKENVPQTLRTVPDFGGKSFKQIYMANVPDRHLDLTMFEPPKIVEKVLEPKDFLQFNDSRTCNTNLLRRDNEKLASIENTHFGAKFKEPTSFGTKQFPMFKENFIKRYDNALGVTKKASPPNRTEICVQTEPLPDKCTDVAVPDGPTISDLYNIMKQQNEQIMLLQQQVNELKCGMRQPEIDSVERNFLQDLRNSPKRLVSVGFKKMSYEISYHTQQPKFRKHNEFLEQKIEEVTERESGAESHNSFLNLDDSLDVKDSYVSNLQSIAFEKEYLDKIEVSDEEETEIDDVLPDIMNDVERFLRKRIEESRCQMPGNSQDRTRQTVKAMKQATLAHLKDIGINLPPIQESSEVTESELDVDFDNKSEVNHAVQELLMKYLPDDKLAKVVNKQKKNPVMEKKKIGDNELSLGTLQYLKKYNLIDTRQVHEQEKRQNSDPQTLHLTALRHQRDYL